jgi:hypothetical protein
MSNSCFLDFALFSCSRPVFALPAPASAMAEEDDEDFEPDKKRAKRKKKGADAPASRKKAPAKAAAAEESGKKQQSIADGTCEWGWAGSRDGCTSRLMCVLLRYTVFRMKAKAPSAPVCSLSFFGVLTLLLTTSVDTAFSRSLLLRPQQHLHVPLLLPLFPLPLLLPRAQRHRLW